VSVSSRDGATRHFDLTETEPAYTMSVRIQYLDDGDSPLAGGEVAVERFVLALRSAARFPLLYAQAGLDALAELELLDRAELDDGLRRVSDAAAQRRPVMNRVQRVVFPDQPQRAGVRVGGVILFDDAISIRWSQLPPEYRPGGPEPWLLLDYTDRWISWSLQDDVGTIYHPLTIGAGHGGFFTYPYWIGDQIFAPQVPAHASQLRLTIQQRTATLQLTERR
jgi:hypothetical protein